jgi:hypothetical protein
MAFMGWHGIVWGNPDGVFRPDSAAYRQGDELHAPDYIL